MRKDSPPPDFRAGVVVGDDGRARTPWGNHTEFRDYYDTEWGMPLHGERELFESLSLECFQCGLSWLTVFRKRAALRQVFHNFEVDAVARMTDSDIAEALLNPGIIRHRAKITATVNNARRVQELRSSPEGLNFQRLIWSFQPETTPRPASTSDIPTNSAESTALSKKLKKQGFKFVGPTTMYALMEAIGMVDTHLMGSHRRGSSGIWIDTERDTP